MNLLAVKLFLTKYYDLVFFVIFITILWLVILLNKSIKKTWFNERFSRLQRLLRYNNVHIIVLVLVLIIGFAVRLYKINNPIADWHSFRQADTASVTREYINEGINLLIPRYQDISRVQSGLFNPEGFRFVEFPIYNALHVLLLKSFGIFSLEVWGRLLSVSSALLTSVFIYKIGKKLENFWFGLLSSTFYLLLPFNIYFTRVILPEPLAILFSMISLWFFLLYTEKKYQRLLYFSSIFLSLGVLVKPYVVFFGAPFIYYFFGKYGLFGSLRKKEVILSLLIIFVPFIAWRLWMYQFPEGIPFWKWTFNGDAIRFKPAFWRWIFGERIGYLILGIWGLIPFAFGLINLKKTNYFFTSLLVGMLTYVSIFATANVRHDYYQSLIIPSISFILAKGVIFMWKENSNFVWQRRFVLLFSLMLAFLISTSRVMEFYKINHPEIIEAGKAVDILTPKDALVIAAYNGDTAFLYQTKRKGWPVVELPIDELIKEGADYYISVNFDSQTQEFMKKFDIIKKTDKYVIIKLN